jgi:hypothetical protein
MKGHMTSIAQRIQRLEAAQSKGKFRALSDAERAVRLAALKPGTLAYAAAWAILGRRTGCTGT